LTSEERRARLVAHLHSVESASIDDLADLLMVSKMTVHRDLDRLEEQRVVRKSRGGATLLPSTIFEADYAYRSQLAVDEKALIARAATDQVERGMAILVDDSSTAAQLIPLVLDKRPLTVITNSLGAIRTYCRTDGISLLAIGGAYDAICDAFFGIVAEQSISRLRVDLAVLSAAAVRAPSVYFHNPEVARFKLACLASAERSVLLVDHTKFNNSALHMCARLDAFDEVITTDLVDPQVADALRKSGVPLSQISTRQPATDNVPAFAG
jgi:DeoR/GlpR family transcriptional regulator of sugar metabolism